MSGHAALGSVPPIAETDGLFPALRRLDGLLEVAVARARAEFGAEAAGDRFRGLYIADREVDRLLAREPGAPLLFAPRAELAEHSAAVARLAEPFGLTEFDCDVLLLALACEVDLRYERLFAYLQDDVTRRRPTVDLALSLLCGGAAERVACLARFGSGAPLRRHGLLELVPDAHAVRPPLLAHYLKLDDQIVRHLLGTAELEGLLASCARLHRPHDRDAPDDGHPGAAGLAELMRRAADSREPLRLYLQGPPGSGRSRWARAAAAGAGVALLEVDLALAGEDAATAVVTTSAREAGLRGAALYLREIDRLLGPGHEGTEARVRASLGDFPAPLLLSGRAPWVPGAAGLHGVVVTRVGTPPVGIRRAVWRRTLDERGLALDEDMINGLASRFRLGERQITDAAATACARARSRAPDAPARGDPLPDPAELYAAAREQTGHALAALATRIEPVHRWDDLVLPDDELAQLRELCRWVRHRDRVLADWGFGARLARGKGVNALFSGPSGTGKTMAAEIVAGELGMNVFRIELAGVVSKYIGETEKNLDRIFRAAEDTDAILLFDEADALFGKRSEVHDSHDRYANIEISYLLQRMEEHEGVAILSTNLRGNLDQAFLRRLAFIVHFPFPDAPHRRRIWERVWPPRVPLDDGLDVAALAERFPLSGGNIRNIALAAAFLAAEGGGPVRRAHLLQAIRREFQKVGKALSDDEIAPDGPTA